MDATYRGDFLGRGPGAKRVPNLLNKLSAGEAATEADIRRILDDLFDPEAAGGWRAQVALESLSLLCGTGAGRRLTDNVVSGDNFLERLNFMLQQELRLNKKTVTGNTDIARSALQLVSRLPDEAACKLFATREATQALHAYVTDHPDERLRSFAISRLASVCARCWAFLDRRAFLNGGFEEGADAQRFNQRVRDWVNDFFASVVRLCDDESDKVAAAAFAAIAIPLKAHPLCRTAVDEELRSCWNNEGSRSSSSPHAANGFNRQKQVFPLQHLGEVVLRAALPRTRRLLLRQSKTTAHAISPPAIATCGWLLVAALRLSTDPSGKPIDNPLLDTSAAVDFLGAESIVAKKTNGHGHGRAELDKEGIGVVESSVARSLFELARDWVDVRLKALMESGDALLGEAAAWATLRVLHPIAMRALRASTAPRVAEAFLRVLPRRPTPTTAFPHSLDASQQEAAVGVLMALRMSSPSAIAVVMPHLLAAAEGIPAPRRRLAVLADAFFFMLVRPAAGGGRAARRKTSRTKEMGIKARQNGKREGRGIEGDRPGQGSTPLVSEVLRGDWFVALVSDTPRESRRLVFREEVVAAVATACAQVLTAGAVAVLSSACHKRTATGIGTLATARAKLEGGNVPTKSGSNGDVNGSTADSAKSEKARWLDLETWLAAGLSTLEACTRCVTWTSSAGYVAGLAYVRLFSFILRLLCSGAGTSEFDDIVFERSNGTTGERASSQDGGGDREGMLRSLQWARERLASIVDDLMWRLREGLPGRDVRLRLLQATCSHLRLLAVVGGGARASEDASMELVSVLQCELGELDAQAGLLTQPQRPPAMMTTGELTGDYNSTNGPGSIRATGDRRTPAPATAAGSAALENAAGSAHNYGGAVGGGQPASFREEGGLLADEVGMHSSSVGEAGKNIADVMAHELVVGCLLRLALSAEGDTAAEVRQVLEDERGRARARERLGRDAVGPMEEAVAKGIHVVDLLIGQVGTQLEEDAARLQGGHGLNRHNSLPRAATAKKTLLKRLLGTMNLGWQAIVQPDERVLSGGRAGVFDHGANAFPDLHRRLRKRLCRSDVSSFDRVTPTNEEGHILNGVSPADEHAAFDAHAWEEEAPHCQLNGGSDPVVVVATHLVNHSHQWANGGDEFREDLSSTEAVATGDLLRNVSDAGGAGRGRRDGGVMLRLKVYNATNARLHGFTIRLSFGQGVEAAGMEEGGRVETFVDEVLMPAAAFTLEVPVAPVGGLKDVVVHVAVVFPDAEPEPEFESEGTAELLGGEALGMTAGRGSGAAHFGGQDGDFDGSGGITSGGKREGGGVVSVTINAGSYRLPAEVFLGPPPPSTIENWVDFQTVWSGLPYVHAVSVETCRIPGKERLLHTATGVRRAMSVNVEGLIGGCCNGTSEIDSSDPRGAAAVRCPGGNTDYALSAAWAFQAWDETPVLCAVTAMKGPFSYTSNSAHEVGRGNTGGSSGDGSSEEQQQTWSGRMEIRCGSHACAAFVQSSSGRLARFVTNGTFAPVADAREQTHQQHQLNGGALAAVSGGYNGPYTDWFSRTDLSLQGGKGRGVGLNGSVPPSPARSGEQEARGTTRGKTVDVLPFVRALKTRELVDSTRGTEVSQGCE